ncbi:MAG: hypothetical protein WCN27_03085, partial [Alphaproteobacteria bacterium]
AAPSHDAAEDRSVVEARRLKRQRPVPLDIEEEDVVTAAAAAPGSFPSPESARSRAGTGVGSHHVAPLMNKGSKSLENFTINLKERIQQIM